MASSSLLLQNALCCNNHGFSAFTQRSESPAGACSPRHCSYSWTFHRASLRQAQKLSLIQVRAEEGQSGSSGGEKLWRSELLTDDPALSSWSEDSLLQRDEADTEQVQQSRRPNIKMNQEEENSGSVMNLVGSLIEKLLVADFFFIVFVLVWFLAGLAEKAAFDTSTLIDAWFPLWSPVFQPALGFFMAAALWTALKNWLKR